MSSSFGRLALGVVGAVIGAPFGLSAIGFAIGSAVGGFIFAPEIDGPDVEGPRVGDTDVTTSTLGKTIFEHYGVTRAAGNVFWSAGLKETETVEDVGGGGGKGTSGGGGGTQTTYSYFGNFAVGFGRGRAEAVLRIWADGKLIYDVTGTGDVQNDKYKFRFRAGSSVQRLDNLIAESINRRLQGLPDVNEGTGPQSTYKTINELLTEAQTAAAAGDARAAIYVTYLTNLINNAPAGTPNDYSFTPAYRDLCYIIFEDMPLVDFGNRIPNITAEIAWGEYSQSVIDATNMPLVTNVTQNSSDTSAPPNGVGVDVFREVMVVRSGNRLRKFSAATGSEVLNRPATGGQLNTTAVTRILGATAGGNIIARATASGQQTLVRITSESLLIAGDRDFDTGLAWTLPNDAATITHGASLGSRSGTELFGGIAPSGYFYAFRTNTSNIQYRYGADAAVNDIQLLGDGPMCNGGEGINYVLASDAGDTQYRLYKITVNWGVQGSDDEFFLNVQNQALTAATSLSGQIVSNIVYDPSGDRIYGLFSSGATGRIIKWRPNGTEVYNRALTHSIPSDVSGLQRSSITNGRLVYASGTTVVEIDLNTGDETLFANALSANASTNTQIYIASKDTLFTWIGTQPVKVEMGRNNSATAFQSETTVQSVINNICRRTGMRPNEFTVDGIDPSLLVRGYTIGRPSTGRASLQKLMVSYFVDGIESDHVIKFRDKTTTAIKTLTENELGQMRGPTGDVNFLEVRAPEYDLPSEINIAFTDEERDYQQGAAHYRRVAQPTPTMYSEKTQNLELPIVFNEIEATNIAQRLMFDAWLSRDASKALLNWTHLELDPGDVVNIAFNNGRVLTDRIGKATVGANFEIEIEAARSGDPVYTPSTLVPVITGGVPSTGIVTPVYSELFVLDIPLLEDFHDLGRTAYRYYTAVGSDTTAWLSATLYGSFDASQFFSIDTHSIDITWGQCQNALAAPRALWATDLDNTLTVQFSVNNGDVNSTTRENIINQNANRALIWNPDTGVGEIIQFETVTNNSDGSVTLSKLVRGVRGTDYAAYGHVEGEYFILLTDAAILKLVNPLEVLGSTQYFRAVSLGGLLGTVPTVSTVWQGRDLKPYAPSRVRRAVNGADIDITWNRRTRLGGEWNMITNIEALPIYEDSEEYEFFLLPKTLDPANPFDPDNVSSFLFSRTVTSPTYKITAAELTAATYLLTDPINIAVCQISQQAGRGFITTGTLRP